MALGWNKPLTGMSAGILPGVKRGQSVRKTDNLTATVNRLSKTVVFNWEYAKKSYGLVKKKKKKKKEVRDKH
jgi:hypothetical protein